MELPTEEELRERREALDLTQSELADAADVSQPLVARIEGGDVDPRLSTLRRIVEALNEAEGEIRRARDIMHVDVVTVRMDDSVAGAIDIMGEAGFSQLPVVDETGTPVGIISNSDIREHREDRDVEALPVADVMNEGFATVAPEATVDEVDNYLDHQDAVIVKDGGQLVGIVTEADIATHLSV
ncbi:CBS domain-containing protein [Halorubellus salinus]|uniref:CBS domain-containing protein n=1 Tax=Halorubellus salinus TaxID=755309 RepID=UPI001D07A265|nr:CBS domain-containing protein [Halorubellus salinus]